MPNYYQPEIETMPYEQLRELQNERLLQQVRHVWDNVPYYRAKMEAKGVTPEDIRSIDDLHKLPFLSKDDLREAYPYGLLAKPLDECVRIQSTSGTTGRRVVAFYTQNDIDLWEDCCARAIVAAGGTNEDVCHVAYGYGLFTGGAGLNGGDGIHTQALCVGSQLLGVGGVVAGDVSDDGQLALGLSHDVLQNQLALFLALVDALAGGTANVQTLNTLVDEPLGQSLGALDGDSTVVVVAGVQSRNNAFVLLNVLH